VLFASRVGARVCAEGIETVDELRTIVNLDVAYAQGYLLGRPENPWVGVPPEITRALGTGALRSHAATAGRQPARVPPAPAAAPSAATGPGTFGVPREQIFGRGNMGPPAAPAGPVNRRLNRYGQR
jgi:EAL domain-containing protein (putative c-di-GMP-specific phosphodiesterase class I)